MKQLPWLIVAILLAFPLIAQTTAKKFPTQGPIKVFGIPHPDEWIDIESNEVGPTLIYRLLEKLSPHFSPHRVTGLHGRPGW